MVRLYSEAEEFINEIFWSETHDKSCNLDIPAIINARMIEHNKTKDPDYYGHREGVVHVTSLSKCLRGVALEMLGAKKDSEIDPRKLGVFRAGNLFEEFIVDSLGDKMQDRQTEYSYPYKGLIFVGRDDGTILYENVRRVLEAKSVRSDSFWYREKEGTLVSTHNQAQLQTYLWFRRVLLNDPVDGIFTYISKDDCTVIQAPVKFNQHIIDDVVIPTMDILAEAYAKKDATLAPVPPMVVYSKARGQYQKNFIAAYCEYHNQCVGEGWLLEAGEIVTRKNKEAKEAAKEFKNTIKKDKSEVSPAV